MNMETKKLNILPAPTFNHSGVNFTEREINIVSQREQKIITGSNKTVKENIYSSCGYEINVCENESLTVIMYISPNSAVSVDTSITAAEYSYVKIVQVFDGKPQIISGISADLSENAKFELVQLYIKGNDTISEIVSSLNGRKAEFSADIGYLLNPSDNLDINLIVRHKGKKTLSKTQAKGVLNSGSRKTFKGTIDFLRGSAGAKGSENEDVLLLGENTVNKTVPLILCSEEDVDGSHGASIGRIDEKHIFYMQSRGIPEEKIREIISRSKLNSVIRNIRDVETVRQINARLGQGEENE